MLQLIVYPQEFDGTYQYDSIVNNVDVVNDSAYYLFSIIGVSHGTTSGTPADSVMTSNAPFNAWQGYNTTGGVFDSTTAPTTSTAPNNLTLTSTGTGKTGVYQLIDNLTAGAQYDLEIHVASTGVGTLSVRGNSVSSINGVPIIGGATNVYSNSFVATGASTIITHNITCQSNQEILCINWESTGNTSVTIRKVHLRRTSATITNVTDGQEILDLYGFEPMALTLSADDFKNIAEKTQSHSKAFKLPATKHNNRIFNHLYDVTIATQGESSVFNPYKISRAVLKENGNVIFEGGLKLIDIQDKDGEISYNVNLFSSSISLKNAIGNKTFNDFVNGFTELEHSYNKNIIKDSWIGKLPVNALGAGSFAGSAGDTTTDVLKYPFCRWNGNILQYTKGPNINRPRIQELSDVFRPWIRCKYLVDRIIHEAGFQYQSDFMEGIGNYAGSGTSHEADFKRLFMDFNWGNDKHPANITGHETLEYIRDAGSANLAATTSPTRVKFNTNQTALTGHGWSASNNEFTAATDNIIYDSVFELNFTAFGATPYEVRLIKEDASGTKTTLWSANHTTTANETTTFTGVNQVLLNQNEKLYFEFEKDSGSVIQGNNQTTDVVTMKWVVGFMPGYISSDVILAKRGKVKQWEFLKDLFTMFNLVVLKSKEDDTILKIEPYDDIFIDNELTTNINPVVYDWTSKVDLTETKLKPIPLKQTVDFMFAKDNKDYGTNTYEDSTGNMFGDFKIDASDFTVSTGEQKIQLKVFASTFCAPLFSNFDVSLTVPAIYTEKSDGSIDGFDNKPRILYDQTGNQNAHTDLRQLNFGAYYIPPAAGLASEFQSRVCIFSHVTDYPTNITSRDFNFGPHQLISFVGNAPVDNLFNTYWNPYYDELYNSDTKTMSVKALLTPLEISTINFYDVIQIKNRQYRINKIDYKPYELSVVELILLT